MRTKLTKIFLSFAALFLIASSVSYAAGFSEKTNLARDETAAEITRGVYWTCEYHPQQRFYVERMPSVQWCSYSPDKLHVWTRHGE